MSSEEGRSDERRHGRPDAPYHAKHLQLVLEPQPVTALYLQGGRALCEHLTNTHHALLEQFVLGCIVQQVRGVQYSAAAGRDFFVRQPCELVEELAFAAPGIDQMRVRIAERRNHEAARRVDYIARARRLTNSEIRNPPIL